MDANAVPHFRSGGPSAAAQTFGARERHRRGEAAFMADGAAGSVAESPGSGFPSLSDIGTLLKRGDKPEWQHNQDYWAEKDEFPKIDLKDRAFVYG